MLAEIFSCWVGIVHGKGIGKNRTNAGSEAMAHLVMLLQEWQSSEGAVLPIQCIMDVVGNAFNDNNPAGLPVAQHLLPLIQDSRKGPAIDFDAFLLVMLEEHMQGRMPCLIRRPQDLSAYKT